jgi:hypothetical protein
MITFRTRSVRNYEVNAWDISVEAYYEPPDEIMYDANGADLTPLLQEKFQDHPDGIRIAELKGLLVKGLLIFEPDDVIETISDHSEIGSTFDIYEGSYSTARNFLGWLEHGGDEKLFGNWEDPIQEIFVSEYLETDPHVDRGAILALMTAQLDQFSSSRLLCVHEEPVDDFLPEDQRGRMADRVRTLSSVARDREIEFIAAHPGAEARGKELRISRNALGEPLPLPGQLPLFILATSADGYPNLSCHLFESEEMIVLDTPEWFQARFGFTLGAYTDEEPEPEPF